MLAAPSPRAGYPTAGGEVLAAPSPRAGCPTAEREVLAAPFPHAGCPMTEVDAGCATAVPSRKQNSGSDLRAFPSSGNLRVKRTWKSATEQLPIRYRKNFSLFYNTHLLHFFLSTLHYTFEMILRGAPCYTPLKNLCVPMNVWDVSYGLNAAKRDYNQLTACLRIDHQGAIGLI